MESLVCEESDEVLRRVWNVEAVLAELHVVGILTEHSFGVTDSGEVATEQPCWQQVRVKACKPVYVT